MGAEKDPFQVRVQHAVPPRLVTLQEMTRLVGQPGIVDQHLHVAEPFERCVEQAVHRGLLGDVRGHADGFTARLLDRLRHVVGACIDVVHDDARTLLPEALGDRPADPTPGPGHDHDGSDKTLLLLPHGLSVSADRRNRRLHQRIVQHPEFDRQGPCCVMPRPSDRTPSLATAPVRRCAASMCAFEMSRAMARRRCAPLAAACRCRASRAAPAHPGWASIRSARRHMSCARSFQRTRLHGPSSSAARRHARRRPRRRRRRQRSAGAPSRRRG